MPTSCLTRPRVCRRGFHEKMGSFLISVLQGAKGGEWLEHSAKTGHLAQEHPDPEKGNCL